MKKRERETICIRGVFPSTLEHLLLTFACTWLWQSRQMQVIQIEAGVIELGVISMSRETVITIISSPGH